MMGAGRRWFKYAGGLLIVATLAGCAVFKPGRVLPPGALGLTCVSETLCLEDPTRQVEAEALATRALSFVESNLGAINEAPRIYFCSSNACFAKFGDPRVSGLYFWGANDIAVNDKGWQDHILRHELIHHWQAENFGVVPAGKQLPRWYIEGMAYVLSEDPRPVIPNEKAQGQRAQFRQWIDAGNDWRVPPDR